MMKSSIVKNTIFQNLLLILLVIDAFYVPISLTFGVSFVKGYQYVLLLFVGVFALKHLSEIFRNRFVLWQFVLVILLSIAFFVFSTAESTTQYKCLLYTLLIFPTFYSERFSEKSITIALILIIIGLWYSFYFSLSAMKLEDENAYGGGYFPLVAYALGLYLLRGKKLKYAIIWSLLSMLLVLVSGKRGDILAFGLGFLAYFYFALKKSGNKGKSLIVFIIVIVIGALVFKYMLGASDVLQMRFDQTKDGETNNRDVIYSSLWYYFLNRASFFEKLFGGGFDATVSIVGRAHSDILEILTSNGIVGILVYIFSMFSLLKQSGNAGEHNKPIVYLVLSIWLVKAIFSMFIYDGSTLFLFMLCGLLVNKNNKIDHDTV